MTRRSGPFVRLPWILAAAVSGMLLTGCASGPALVKVARVDPANPEQYVDLADESATGVTVYRDGHQLEVELPQILQPGDEVETKSDSVAVIRYANLGEVLVNEATRVRLGSLDVLFGEIFAHVKGWFSVEGQLLVAGVEGTEFAFIVNSDQRESVAVREGTVRCTPKTRAWKPVHLPQWQTLVLEYGQPKPQVSPASAHEIGQLNIWAALLDRLLPPPSANAQPARGGAAKGAGEAATTTPVVGTVSYFTLLGLGVGAAIAAGTSTSSTVPHSTVIPPPHH